MTYSDEQIERQVIEIFADLAVRDPETVKITDTMEELGIDSLGMVEGIFAIEEAFDVSVPFNANDPEANDIDLSTLKAVANAVRGLVSEKAA